MTGPPELRQPPRAVHIQTVIWTNVRGVVISSANTNLHWKRRHVNTTQECQLYLEHQTEMLIWGYESNCRSRVALANGLASQIMWHVIHVRIQGLRQGDKHPPTVLLNNGTYIYPHQCYSSEVDSRQNYSRVHTSYLTAFVSASLWLNIFVPWSWSLWIYVTLMTILILTN